ncbi:MAG: CAP domain-containing protein [Archangiaceae bacterium]|nr:CAP domain-containing protein [Archangiaceae bacterium]
MAAPVGPQVAARVEAPEAQRAAARAARQADAQEARAGGTAGGSAGGTAGGSAGGTAGGTAGGRAGGSAGGSAGGTAGGSAGGASGGLVFADAGTYGNPVNGFPMWRERTISVLTNAVRISPVAYKQSTTYGNTALNVSTVLDPGVYPARAPLYWDLGLNQSSRQHSQEMADFNYFAHTSLDGGSPFVRIAQYYTRSGTLGENIAAGTHGSEVQAMIQWLCDAPQGSSPCCVDGQNCDGHRASIMSNGFHAMGSGYGFSASSTYDHYWTQDFGGLAAPPAPPLVDGTHLLIGNSSTRFIANFYATAPAQAVKVVIDGVQNSMAVDLGDATRGTWFVLTTRGTACRSYYFLATTSAGLTWRYPAAGAFRTRGEGQAACTEEYLP